MKIILNTKMKKNKKKQNKENMRTKKFTITDHEQ